MIDYLNTLNAADFLALVAIVCTIVGALGGAIFPDKGATRAAGACFGGVVALIGSPVAAVCFALIHAACVAAH